MGMPGDDMTDDDHYERAEAAERAADAFDELRAEVEKLKADNARMRGRVTRAEAMEKALTNASLALSKLRPTMTLKADGWDELEVAHNAMAAALAIPSDDPAPQEQVAALAADNERLRALIKAAERSDFTGECADRCCPWCSEERGHHETCPAF